MLTKEGCGIRRRRFLKEMEAQSWDAFITADRRTAFYFTGFLASTESATIFILGSDGRTTLISNSTSKEYADEMVFQEAYSIDRCIDFLEHDAAATLGKVLKQENRPTVKNWALEKAAINTLYQESLLAAYPQAQILDASQSLVRQRKKKEEDEIHIIRENLKYCAAAYDAARETIEPGVTECDVYSAMYSAIVSKAESSVDFAGDFACGERGISGGGPPTPRELQAGDLYILDIFPASHLYNADTCRVFAVTEPTDLQHRAWEITMQAVRLGESMIKPGVRARDVYGEIKTFMDSQEISEGSFWHHAGHGLGYSGHCAPRIIPGSNDVFEEGDVFTLEPGMYSKALQGGLRLEDNYVLRVNGPEDLFSYPWEL